LTRVVEPKIRYTTLQRRALLSADLEAGRLLVVDDQGHAIHLMVRRALVKKGLLTFVSLDHYALTELGATEARRLQAEQASRKSRKVPEKPAATSHSEPLRTAVIHT
jgi:hypothetical protein